MANMTFKANLLPDNTAAQRELGSSTAKWKINGYFPVVSVIVTGGGNAVTSITNTDGQVTVTKGTTFLTSHQSLAGYLPLSGGTMTGAIKRYYSSASTDPTLSVVANNQDATALWMGHGTAAGNPSGNYYKFLYKGTGSSPNNYFQLVAGVSSSAEVIAMQVNEQGNVSFTNTVSANISGTAAKATADASGNTITTTYLTKASGVTAVTWNSTNKKITRTINGSAADVVQFLAGSNITLTGASGKLTIASTDTNNAVTQTETTTNSDYRLLLSSSADTTTTTAGVGKSTNLRFNPSTKVLSVGGSISATGDFTLTGDAHLNSETYADSITAGSLLVTGAAAFTNIPTAPTPVATSNDTSIATTAFVKNNIGGLSGAMHYIGITSTTLTDGATTSTLTAKTTGSLTKTTGFIAGDVVLYNDGEYVWTGSFWEQLGDSGSFKTRQTAVTTATTASTATATTFVSAIEQDANGVIKYTTKVLPTYNNYSHPTTTAVDAAAVKVGKDSLGHVVLGSALTYSDVGAASASHGTHVTFASSGTPAALGTASHGSATTVARSDHVHAKPTPADIGAAAASHGTHVTYSSTTPKALGTAAVGTENAVARGDHVHPKPSLTDLGAAASSHTHGNITNDGKITTTATIASGDKIVIVDSDTTAASKITGSSITFGTSANYALANNGTWQAFTNNAGTVTQITAGTGLTTTSGGSTDGGSITGSGTLYLTKTGTTTGSFGMSTNTTGSNNTKINIPYITVDAYGRITSISNKEYTSVNTEGTDTKNTAGSTDTSSKIFLVGATSQTANAQTYSDNQVYATNGQLDANKVRVAEHVTLQYNTTTNALDFVFV